jgi:hypothetical protein
VQNGDKIDVLRSSEAILCYVRPDYVITLDSGPNVDTRTRDRAVRPLAATLLLLNMATIQLILPYSTPYCTYGSNLASDSCRFLLYDIQHSLLGLLILN